MSSSSTANTPEPALGVRLSSLDTLRGIAILLVLFRHMGLPPLKSDARWFMHGLSILQCGGWTGVDLFFVLSGFLVSGLLFRQQARLGHLRITEFLTRRAYKIYPPFWAMLICMVIFRWLSGGFFSASAIVYELLFVQNYFRPGYCVYTWSLAVEEHFYLLLAFLFWLWPRSTVEGTACFPGLTQAGFLLIVCEGVLRWSLTRNGAIIETESFEWSHLRFDGFVWGVLLAYWYQAQPLRFLSLCQTWRWPALFTGAALLFPCFVVDFVMESPVIWKSQLNLPIDRNWIFVYGLSLNALAGALWICSALGFSAASKSPQRRSGALAWIGRHSYGIYLWHMLFGFYFSRIALEALSIRLSFIAWIGIYLITSILSGVILTKLIENPALWLRDKLCPDTAARPPAAIPSTAVTAP